MAIFSSLRVLQEGTPGVPTPLAEAWSRPANLYSSSLPLDHLTHRRRIRLKTGRQDLKYHALPRVTESVFARFRGALLEHDLIIVNNINHVVAWLILGYL